MESASSLGIGSVIHTALASAAAGSLASSIPTFSLNTPSAAAGMSLPS